MPEPSQGPNGDTADVAVIGGGIAGASVAYWAAGAGARVTLVERERELAFHTTGRSAAQYLENYGDETVRRLTMASRSFLHEPPADLVDRSLLSPRPMLEVGHESDLDLLRQRAADGQRLVASIELIDGDEVRRLCPVLRPEAAAAGVYEPDASDIDVAALHAAFIKGLRRSGGEVRVRCEVLGLRFIDDRWRLLTSSGPIRCRHVVNAAGAWADVIARMAEADPVGLRPLRRTAFTVGPYPQASGWPLVHDVRERYYFKPEGDGLLCSPADETESEPVDARVDIADVAAAIEQINSATTLSIRSVRSEWAGLRTFAPDRGLVLGPDPQVDGLHWCAGQGGFGIQTAPAAGALVAALITGGLLPAGIGQAEVENVSPARFGNLAL